MSIMAARPFYDHLHVQPDVSGGLKHAKMNLRKLPLPPPKRGEVFNPGQKNPWPVDQTGVGKVAMRRYRWICKSAISETESL